MKAIIFTLLTMFFIAILYRLIEIFCKPHIFTYYKQRDPSFVWGSISKKAGGYNCIKEDFVNAIERSNVIVWIGITLKPFALWHERKNTVLQAELNALKGQLHPHFLFNFIE